MPPRDSSGPGSGPNPFSGSGPGGPFLTAVTISENGPFPTTVTEPIPPPPSQDIPTLTVVMTPVVQSLSLETVTSGHMTLTKTHVATQSDTVVNPSSGAIGTGNASVAASGANGSAGAATATTTTTAVAAAVAGTAHSSVLSRGVLIGIIATGVGLIALIIFLVALLIRRGKRRRSEEEMFKPTAFTPVEDEHRILSPKEAGRQEMTQQRPVDDGGLAASGGQQADVKRWPEEEPDPEGGRERQVQVHEGEQPPSPLPPPVNGPGGNHDPLVLPLASLARSFNPNETFFSPGTQGPPSISRIPPGTLDLSSYPLMPAFQLSPPGGPGTGYVSTESVLSRPPGFHTAGQGDQDSFLDMTGLGHGHGFRSGSGEYHVAEIPVLIRRDARGGGVGGQAVAFGLLEEPAPPYKERASSRVSAVEEGTGGDEPDAQEAEVGSSGVVSLPEQETEVADAEQSLL